MRQALLAIVVLSIGSGYAAAAPPTKADPNTPGAKLGHFSTPDGLVGAVIDRTGAQFKLKMDKSNDIVALFMEKQKNWKGPTGHYLNGADGKPILFLSEHGGLFYIKPEALSNLVYNMEKGRGLLPLRRDAEAKPLGSVTKQGIAQPPPAKSPAEKYSDGLQARSAVKALGFKPQDSGNLAKIEAAFRKAKPGMFVHVTPAYAAQFRWQPASSLVDNTDHAGGGDVTVQGRLDTKWTPRLKGIRRYGISFATPCEFNSPCRVRQLELEGWPPPLKANTVGLVWDVNSTFITLVTLDGGRYSIGQWWGDYAGKGEPLKAGVPPKAGWPEPLQHETFDLGVVRMLAKGGAIAKSEAGALEALEDAYFSCKKEVWKTGAKEAEKVEASSETFNRKAGKLTGIAKKYEKLADKKCAGTVTKYEKEMVAFIEARNKKRLELYNAVKGLAR